MAALTLDISVRPTLDVAAANKVTSALKLALGQQASDLQLIDPKEFERAADGAHELQQELDDLRRKVQDLETGGKGLGKAFDFNNTLTAVREVAGGLNELSQPSIALDTATAQMRALGGEAIELAPRLREAALEMGASGQFAQSAAELQSTMTEALASGVKGGEEGLKQFAQTAAKLATGGGSSIGAATQLIAGQLNAYGESAESAGRFSDVFFNTVNAGVTSVDELSNTLANVIPTAAGAGIEIENVGGALALMTQKGIPTAQSTTKLNQLLLELQKPAKDLEPILKKAGVSLESLKQDDLPTTLAKVKTALDATGKSAVQVFSSSEASAAFQTLAGDLDGFRETFETVRDTAGSTDAAYGQMSDSIAVKTAQMQSQVESFVTQGLDVLGTGFLGVVNSGTQLAPVLTSLSGVKALVPDAVIDKIGKNGLSGALEIATTGAKGLVSGIASAGKAMISFLVSPAGIALAATAALVVGVIALNDAMHVSAEEALEATKAEGQLLERRKEQNKQEQSRLQSITTLAQRYEELGSKAKRTAKEERELGDVQIAINRHYPGLIDSTKSYAENLKSVQTQAGVAVDGLKKLRAEMFRLETEAAAHAARMAERSAQVLESNLQDALIGVQGGFSGFFEGLDDSINGLFGASSDGRINASKAVNSIATALRSASTLEQFERAGTAARTALENGLVKKGAEKETIVETLGLLDQLIDARRQKFQKVQEPVAAVPPVDTATTTSNTDDHKKETQKFFADFRDVVTNGQREIEDAQLGIQLAGADNRLAALALEYERQLTTVNRKQDDLRESVTTKAAETNEAYQKALKARKDGDPLPTIEIVDEEKALKTIERARGVLQEAAQLDFAGKLAESLFAVNDADVARSVASIERGLAVVTGTSVAALQQRAELEGRKLALQQAEQLETFIATLPAYQEAIRPLFANALKEGTPEARAAALASAQVVAKQTAETLKGSNEEVLSFQRAQIAERERLERESLLRLEELRINTTLTGAQKELALRKLEIQRQLSDELALYAESPELQAAARIKAKAAEYDAERENILANSNAKQIAYSLEIGAIDGVRAATERLKDLQNEASRQQLENIDKERTLLKEALNSGLVDRTKYISEMRRLAAEEYRIKEEGADSTRTFEAGAAAFVLATVKKVEETKGKAIEESTDKLTKLSKNGLELSAEAGALQLDLINQTGQRTLAELTAASAEMLAAGEFNLKKLGNIVLKNAFSLAQSEITILIPVIYAKAMGLLGPIAGAIAATAAIALVQGGLAYAQGAIKLKSGISSVPGDPRDGDSVPAILMPGERVVTTEVNRREYHTLERLHRGATTDDIARDWWMEKYGRHFVAEDGSLQRMVSYQGAQIAELAGSVSDVADTVAVLARAQETVARKYKKFQEVILRGRMVASRGQLIAVLEHGSNDEQSLR